MLSVTDFKYKTNCYNSFNAHKRFEHVQNVSIPWESFGKVKIKILLLITMVVAGLLSAQLVFAANLSTDGQTLSSVENEIQKQETENLNLRAKIAQASSLQKLSGEAQQLGFQTPEKVITQ
jgi:cell division protein FtsL